MKQFKIMVRKGTRWSAVTHWEETTEGQAIMMAATIADGYGIENARKLSALDVRIMSRINLADAAEQEAI